MLIIIVFNFFSYFILNFSLENNKIMKRKKTIIRLQAVSTFRGSDRLVRTGDRLQTAITWPILCLTHTVNDPRFSLFFHLVVIDPAGSCDQTDESQSYQRLEKGKCRSGSLMSVGSNGGIICGHNSLIIFFYYVPTDATRAYGQAASAFIFILLFSFFIFAGFILR